MNKNVSEKATKRGNMQPRQGDRKLVRFQIDFSEISATLIEQKSQSLGMSRTNFFRVAAAIMLEIGSDVKEGSKVVIRRPDGVEKELIFIFPL